MLPTQLDELLIPGTPSLHPDGSWAVVSATRPDFSADAYVGQLWKVPLGEGEPRRLTRGFRDTDPKFCPAGKLIAFLRAEPGKPAQLAVMEAGGGEPVILTDRKLGVEEFDFDPDSPALYFTSPVPEEGRYGTIDGVGPDAEDPRHITSMQFHFNGRGYTADQRVHVFRVEIPDLGGEPPIPPAGRAKADAPKPEKSDPGQGDAQVPTPTRLTFGDHDHEQIKAVPGGVLAVSAYHEGRERDIRTDLFFIAPGAEPVQLNQPTDVVLLIYKGIPSGDRIFLLAEDMGENGWNVEGVNPGIWCMPARGGVPTRLTDAERWEVFDGVPSDNGVLAIVNERGDGKLIQVDPSGVSEVLVPADWSIHSLDHKGGRTVVNFASGKTFGDLAQLARLGRESAQQTAPTERPWRLNQQLGMGAVLLTNFSAKFREGEVFTAEELVAKSPDGQPVHGWVVLPSSYEEGGKTPTLLMIHGGPFASYGSALFDEAQVYAGAGYAVVMCNPRGSDGYGQAFGQAIVGDTGNLDHKDIIAFLDAALAKFSGLDADRVGVLGGSYGGYMTAWLIGHETRFKAAIVERGYLDLPGMIGPSDIGWGFVTTLHGDDPDKIRSQSPLEYVGNVTTPTLVLHSEQDLRCPISQGLRYFTELKRRGQDAELLVFPGETHELSRSGRPLHRKARFDAILDWFARKL
ncbi:MAG: S9 family peptidase [Propionibacteriaceae bacterium]|jgi:dipeptidyl aminopeptidase/acylaminoacyl peptidase|nr:S9 family peptidase [Propionibacteriaceae bacterium]